MIDNFVDRAYLFIYKGKIQAGRTRRHLRLRPSELNREGIMFKKVLVPLDGSDIAAKVLPKVVEAAKPSRPK